MNKLAKNNARGFGLLEIMIVMVIVALGVVGIQGRGRIGKQKANVQTESANLSLIFENAQAAQMGRPDYTGVNTAYLLSRGAFPDAMVNTATSTVKNSWGGAVTAGPASNPATLNVVYTAVPTAACVEWVTAEGANFVEITVGTTKTKNGAALPDLSAVDTACKAAEQVTVTFNRA